MNKYTILITIFTFIIPCILGAQDHKTSSPQAGEGVILFLKRHGFPSNEYAPLFIELNSGKFGKDNSMLAGVQYKLPATYDNPQAGEGMILLLRRHGLDDDYFSVFKSINKELLEKNGEDLKLHIQYLIPLKLPSSTSDEKIITEAEPGKLKKTFYIKLLDENIEIEDELLNGYVFYLVSGHGGPDPGAIAEVNGEKLCEDEYAYDITARLLRNLIQHGAKVYMITRDPDDGIRNDRILKYDKDETCYLNQTIALKQIDRLKQRADVINKYYKSNKKTAKGQFVIEIHVDSRSESKDLDVFFYHHKNSKYGKKLAETIKETFRSKYAEHQPNRGYSGTVSSRNLYMLEKTMPVQVYIEVGNIQNPKDRKRLLIADNRQALANWIFYGVKKYLND